MSILINSSGQRRYRFEQCQLEYINDPQDPLDLVLALFMDVSTRWDSTGFMMTRSIRLRKPIDKFCQEYRPARFFALSEIEWKQIGYLIDLVRPFNFFTTTIGKTKGITLPYVLRIYDELFERLDESRRRLKAKIRQYSWVKPLIDGIDAAEAKLDVYYNKTYTNLGSLYAIGAILDPKLKLHNFDEEYCWLDYTVQDWRMEFEEQFRNLYNRDYARKANNTEYLRAVREANMDPLALMLDRSRERGFRGDSQSSGTVHSDDTFSEVDYWLAMSKLY